VENKIKMATIVDYEDFDVEQDCEALHGAMKGLGTDEETITDLITNRSNGQRQEVREKYSQMFGKKLEDALKSELGGHYEDIVLALFKEPIEYDAYELHHAIKGAGTSENVLIEILCSRNNQQIEDIKEAYKKKHGNQLAEDIESDTSGYFGRLMFSLVQGNRNEDDEVDQDQMIEDANALIEAGEAQWGTDESRFNVIMASRSFHQLSHTFNQYEAMTEKNIEEAIENEMSGDIKDGMLAIVKCVRSKARYFAERLYKSMKGAGTDDRTLIRIMVSRSEVDMKYIKPHFEEMYEQTLEDFINDDCSGDYKKALLHLCNGNC